MTGRPSATTYRSAVTEYPFVESAERNCTRQLLVSNFRAERHVVGSPCRTSVENASHKCDTVRLKRQKLGYRQTSRNMLDCTKLQTLGGKLSKSKKLLEPASQRLKLRDWLVAGGIALAIGAVAVPASASAATATYWNGATSSNQSKSSKQASMTGGEGFAVVYYPFRITNVYPDQRQIASATASQGNLASMSHGRVAGAFSGCSWSGGSISGTAGMTCKYRY
jgi:hypothetical protein